MKPSAIVVFLVLLCTGCITSAYRRSTNDSINVRREFNSESQGSCRVYKGIWGKSREIKGEMFHVFQFEDALKGKGRHLEVMIPLKGMTSPEHDQATGNDRREIDSTKVDLGGLFFSESFEKAQGDYPVYLLFQSRESFEKSDYALNGQNVRPRSDPVMLVKENFKYEIHEPRYPLVLVHLNAIDRGTYTARCLIWNRDDGGTVVSYDRRDSDQYDGSKMEIGWRERSRAGAVLRKAGYAGTVLADIITSPVQLVWLLVILAGIP